MPKVKRTKVKRKISRLDSSILDSDNEIPFDDLASTDHKSSAHFCDEIDSFHSQKDKILLEEDENQLSDQDSVEAEEIYPLSDSDDEYNLNLKKDSISSDLDEKNEEGLPDVKAWGKKKSTFYNTNFIDEDYRRGFREDDAEAADAEEKEAMALQKRLIEDINEDDIGLEWFKIKKEEVQNDMEPEEKISKDFSKMSQKEKLEILAKDSPELLDLIKDFKSQLTYLHSNLQPLLPLVKDGRILAGPEANYILIKYLLILHYCTNISYYMILKARGVQVRHHPVIKRLVSYRTLLKKLEPCDEKLKEDIVLAVEKLKNGENIKQIPKKNKNNKKLTKLRILDSTLQIKRSNNREMTEDSGNDAKNHKYKKVKRFETEEEKSILSAYDLRNEQTRTFLDSNGKGNSDNGTENSEDLALNHEPEIDPDQKREITYEIAKNKGLVPYRKKMYRNPRVRHRIKYQKAKIRRKGQVRQPRKELQRYGGEISGIRVGVSKSIKLK